MIKKVLKFKQKSFCGKMKYLQTLVIHPCLYLHFEWEFHPVFMQNDEP